ncbi:hypothetical protein H6P81_018357 [Aristolochia fimbriata]|uniref:RING-type E3 ubiquitin transferase n=1 Tax=Aristolochia fimbriata TaxID=158543 RepID=A0AAV7E548_ARIFI|nr:hypothetical protein H6P81_018357 [Aristolochia fimbriata]
MASLEELLVEEGFRGGRMKSRSSFKADAVNAQRYLRREQGSSASPSSARRKTHRTKSDVSRLVVKTEPERKERGRMSIDDIIRRKKIVDEPKNEVKEIEIVEERDFLGIQKRYGDAKASEEPEGHWMYAEKYGGVYYDDERVYDHIEYAPQEKFGYGNFSGLHEKKAHKEKNRKEKQQGEKNRSKSSGKSLSVKSSFGKNLRELDSVSRGTSNSSRQTKKYDDLPAQMRLNVDDVVPEPALDEAAIQAMISILTGYIKQFVKFEDFRESIQEKCASCLGFSSLRDQVWGEKGVMVNLTQAIEAIEKVAEELEDPKELKKASIQLSVVAGLNSKDLKEGYTSGILNSHLAACAHMYLSAIYKLQKKERVSAKHLLQVFCDSPFQARTCLLPDLWEHLFLPHLAHLRVWYDQEVEAVPNTPGRLRKMELLEKAYNETVDNGTHQFAVYYKEWLTDGVEAPSIPVIHIPLMSVHEISPGSSRGCSRRQQSSLTNSVSSLPLISKELYEAVFGHSTRWNSSDEAKVGEIEEIFTDCARSLDCTIEKSGGSGAGSTKSELWMEDQTREEPGRSATGHEQSSLLNPGDSVGLHLAAVEEVKKLEEEGEGQQTFQNISRHAIMLHELSHTKANELTLKELARAVFQLQQAREPVDSYAVDRTVTKYSAGPKHMYDLFEENSFFSTVIKDFTCPLSGRLFEDPVTLETGQTFERVAIREWFNQGNNTCPLTGRRLENTQVPITNFVLKRVIDCWKSERCKHLLVYACQIADGSVEHENKSKDEAAIFILQQLLTGLNPDEIMENAEHLISLGGLQFLIRRFESGGPDERTSVAALLTCCIKAEGSCRNYVARAINKSSLVKLLHSKQVKSRTHAVLLLIELICLNRRTATTLFLSSLQNEGVMNILHVLLVYLQSSPPEQMPLVAVLMLHIDLLVEPQKYSIYREEAVDALIVALHGSLTDVKLCQQTKRALLILGGHFSSSGELLIETWLLKLAGFYDRFDTNSPGYDDKVIQIDQANTWHDEDHAKEEWLKNMAVQLLGSGKKSFLEAISKCLSSQTPDLVRTCLTTVAWLSRALACRSETELQLSAFSLLVPRLKECLDNGLIECRVLASMTLLHFSELSECRVLLSALAEDIAIPLKKLADVTWTAKRFLSVISGNCEWI